MRSGATRAVTTVPFATQHSPRPLPAVAAAANRVVPGGSSLTWRFYLLAVFLVPLQIESNTVERLLPTRLAPADIALALAVFTGLGSVRFGRRSIDLIPWVFVATLAYGIVLAIVQTGDVSGHALLVKFAGGLVLAGFAVHTAHHARRGRAVRIVAVLVAGMVVWGLIAWVDWRLDDALPLVRVKTPSRFGGAQVDPNNAGAAFAVSLFLALRAGPLAWSRRVRSLVLVALSVFLAATLSRGALVGVVAAGLVLAIEERMTVRRWLRAALVALVVACALLLTGWISRAVEDFSSRPDNVAGREVLALNAIDDLAASRGIGIGLGTYRSRHGEIVHNSALWLATEMSVPGLLLFGIVAAVPIVAARRLRTEQPELGSALLAAHVVMIVASVNIEALYQRPWWIVMGLCATPVAGRTWRRDRGVTPVRGAT